MASYSEAYSNPEIIAEPLSAAMFMQNNASLQVVLDVLSDIFDLLNCTNIIKSLCWIMHKCFFPPYLFFSGPIFMTGLAR